MLAKKKGKEDGWSQWVDFHHLFFIHPTKMLAGATLARNFGTAAKKMSFKKLSVDKVDLGGKRVVRTSLLSLSQIPHTCSRGQILRALRGSTCIPHVTKAVIVLFAFTRAIWITLIIR